MVQHRTTNRKDTDFYIYLVDLDTGEIRPFYFNRKTIKRKIKHHADHLREYFKHSIDIEYREEFNDGMTKEDKALFSELLNGILEGGTK